MNREHPKFPLTYLQSLLDSCISEPAWHEEIVQVYFLQKDDDLRKLNDELFLVFHPTLNAILWICVSVYILLQPGIKNCLLTLFIPILSPE